MKTLVRRVGEHVKCYFLLDMLSQSRLYEILVSDRKRSAQMVEVKCPVERERLIREIQENR